MDLTCSKEFTDVLDDVLFIRQMKAWNILELKLFQTKRAICKCVFLPMKQSITIEHIRCQLLFFTFDRQNMFCLSWCAGPGH